MPAFASPLMRSPWWMPAACVAVILTLMAVVLPSPFAAPEPPEPAGVVQWERSLRFVDQAGGDIAVVDTVQGREVARYQGEQGFVRGTLRALNRQRQLRGIGPQAPLSLIAYEGGRLTLQDDATGEKIHLESFGSTNKAAFERLRDAGASTPIALKE
ncbi:MAG: photosynthetic complex assembly protein PuhC [Betaproteobacteria bacterium]|jgi:putative photosynthetic complex assembly protein|nr:photosynthetic complex assembly protein PuhC [Betaproteobacteria bacterium]NBS45694.1 photosynthetic complex assembly protein PuhC [Betaproteobacteria bacterium]